ncbi:separin protein, partial [Cryomyces antarcticus]
MAGRIKFNTLLADASYIHSMLELAVGSTNDALVHARRCVKLNQRIWASIEHRAFAKQRTRGVVPTDTEVDSLTDRIANVTISSASAPTVMSMTHNSLRGAAFWSLVPSLFRGLCHLSHLFSHEGLFQDSTYYAEQAQKVADAVGATPFVVQNLAMTGEYWCRSGDREKMQECVFKGSGLKGRLEPCSTLVMFSRFQAHFHHLQRDWKKEDKAYDEAEAVLQLLSSSAFIYRLNRINSTEDDLIKQMSDPNVEDRSGRKKQTKVTKVKNPTSVVSRGVPRKPTIPVVSATRNKTIEECWGLTEIQADILRRRALTMLRRDKSTAAVELLERAESIQNGHVGAVPQKLAGFRALMTQAMKELQSDITYNVLPESTISFPSLARRKRRPSEPANTRPSFLSPPQKSRIMSPRKSGRDKSSSKEDFVSTLRKARDCISGVQSLAIQTGSTAVVHEICSVLSHTTILMSAATPLSLHPLTAALSMEYPRIHALQRELLAVQHDKRPVHREDLLKRPASTQAPSRLVHMNISQFQEDFIDIIPSSWSAVSLSLNETRDELYVARYHKGQSPFIIRLPMARHKSRDMDEEVFDFDQGKAELQEVIELSNFSTHDARDMSIKGAKSGWWAEREALDGRLHDLLINMENIWLGGFKGILSPHIRQPNLLARFSKSFENILNRNLPSRQNSKNASKRVTLDSRILELFVGLGNDKDGEIDLDESLMDLLYFVVDVLQFNGEGNAYDEVDFDAIVVETLDALRAYHEATTANTDEMPQHTILVLDKRLHAFPWESMPCMDGLSVSRVPSMGALRDRILAQRAQQQQLRQDAAKQNGFNQSMQQDDRFFLDRTSGAYILNPSGDLTATQTVLDPPLSTLPTSWSSTTGRPPTEAEIAASLSSTDIFLYFGHGSGAQYIRSRTIKNMDKCAVALLMGCSSGTVTEYGDFEPTSVPLAYLAAGSMAVAATLWDVTDKDIDRFS